jgi:hypothetical protein
LVGVGQVAGQLGHVAINIAGQLGELFTQVAYPEPLTLVVGVAGGLPMLDQIRDVCQPGWAEGGGELTQPHVGPPRSVEGELDEPAGERLRVRRRSRVCPSAEPHDLLQVVADDARRVVQVHQRRSHPVHGPTQHRRGGGRVARVDQRRATVGQSAGIVGVLAAAGVRVAPPVAAQTVQERGQFVVTHARHLIRCRPTGRPSMPISDV